MNNTSANSIGGGSFLKKHKILDKIYQLNFNYKTERFLKSVEDKTPDLDVKYIYFPLHLQPECTTLPTGGFCSEQYFAIKMLSIAAKNDGFAVYVKEHPSQFLFNSKLFNTIHPNPSRSIYWYQKIKNLPNVTIISRAINTSLLVDKSFAVATITGTSGLEAVARCKPALIFGFPWYKEMDGIAMILSQNDLDLAISKIKSQTFSLDSRYVLAIFKAFQEHCFYLYRHLECNITIKHSVSNIPFCVHLKNWLKLFYSI